MTLPRSRPLARGKGLKRTGGPKRRARLAPVGRRRRSELSELGSFRRDTLAQAKGRCQRCGRPCADNELDAHHLLPRSQGGKHEAKTNGAALCRPCHRAVHDHSAEDWQAWLRSGKPGAQSPVASGDACPHRSLSPHSPLHRRGAFNSQES